jgi:hypothetical protein
MEPTEEEKKRLVGQPLGNGMKATFNAVGAYATGSYSNNILHVIQEQRARVYLILSFSAE